MVAAQAAFSSFFVRAFSDDLMQQETDEIIEKLLIASRQIQDIATTELHRQIADDISWLILHNFEALVQILYQLDVHEEKLKARLQSNPEKDAAVIIVDMIIARQIEKWKTRQGLSDLHSADNPDADERW